MTEVQKQALEAPIDPAQETMRYKDASLPVKERVEDLLGRMTLREKVGQLNQRLYGFAAYERKGDTITLTEETIREAEYFGGLGVVYGLYRADPWSAKTKENGLTPEYAAKGYNMLQRCNMEHSRLGIPLLLSTECPHGHQALGGYLLPVNLAAGATFDPALYQDAVRVCARQLKEMGVNLSLVSALDVARDPRWGRTEECFGEDPYLCSRFAEAAVFGTQSEGVAMVAKHFCAQGETTGGVNASAARIGERELREIHLPVAKACCKAGVKGIMAAYNEIDGVYCHRNAWLLRHVLRGEMRFDGIVMADGLAVDFLKNTEGDTLHAGVAARKAGVDVSLWDEAFSRLGEAVEQGLLDESEIDESVLKVLKLKFEKGLFEHPYMEENMLTPEEAGIPEVSLSLARESAVLLKNEESVLPLAKKYKKVAVIGYHAADRYCMLGDYTPPVPESECVTVLQGMKQEAPEGVEVSYAMGSEFSEADEDEKAKALALAAKSDVIVAVVGGSSSRFGGAVFDANGAASKGTGSRSMDCGEGMDTAKVHIPAAQEELVAELARLGKPMVTVVIAGRAYCIEDIENASNALLYAFYPGPMGGKAVAEMLYGTTNPSGRLPVSMPRHAGQIPVCYNYRTSVVPAYCDMTSQPLHTFGEGKSYTTFACSDVSVNKEENGAAVSFTVENTGAMAGTSVPCLYVRKRSGGVVARIKELKAFTRISLAPGEKKEVSFQLSKEEMNFVQIPGKPEVICHDYELMLEDGAEKWWSGNVTEM